jgi:predicted MFS family arabinose efflux permease
LADCAPLYAGGSRPQCCRLTGHENAHPCEPAVLNQSGTSEHPKFFYGWWIVVVAGIGLCLGYAPIIVYSFSVFIKPLTQELHSNRASISFAFTLANLMTSISSPLVGRLADRFGARRVILIASTIFSLLLISAPLLPGRLQTLYIFCGLLGFVGSAPAPIPYVKVISRWFDRRRGLALGLTMVGIGSGAILMPALAQRLIGTLGWRSTYMVIGLLVLVVSVPIVAFFLKESPEKMGLLPDGAITARPAAERQNREDGMRWLDVRRSPAFWLIVGAVLLVGVSVHGCVLHLAPLLSDQGVSPQRVAVAFSFLGSALMIGRVLSGYLLDRFFAPRVAMCIFFAVACGIVLLRTSAGTRLIFLAVSLIGLGMGAEADVIAYLISRYFGLRAFGEVYGYVFGSYTLAGALGPWLMGLGFDRSGSYGSILVGFLLATLLAAVLIARLGPYRFRPR